jgi:hypothetical protein
VEEDLAVIVPECNELSPSILCGYAILKDGLCSVVCDVYAFGGLNFYTNQLKNTKTYVSLSHIPAVLFC